MSCKIDTQAKSCGPDPFFCYERDSLLACYLFAPAFLGDFFLEEA